MTNAEKFKTVKERTREFRKFCSGKVCKGLEANCIFSDKIHDAWGHRCEFAWLDLEYKEEKPKPCPFCGGEATISTDSGDNAWVYCSCCGVETKVYSTTDEAIESWNRRVS